MSPPDADAGPRISRTLDELFAGRELLLVGRDPENDVCLPHPSISRAHASLARHADGSVWLADLGGLNGVFVNGTRVREPRRLADGDQVAVGPYLFSLAGGVVTSVDSSHRLRLEARGLTKAVRLSDGAEKVLLDGIDLVIEPGEFAALLGPSGSGKSTLMDCLNGRRRPTGGAVLANGEDFFRNEAGLRQSIGYVPQRDIVHTQLTVERALYYTAKLRLPTDTRPQELQDRIDAVVAQMELGPHRHTLVGELSGGQMKRVSLGAELLAKPSLLYIDEATSGLDAGTEARMMGLFRRLADEGRAVVCITHNIENVESCHLVLILVRGRLAYVGPPADAPGYFGVDRLSRVYDRLSERTPEEWADACRASPQFAEFVTRRREAAPPDPASAVLSADAAPSPAAARQATQQLGSDAAQEIEAARARLRAAKEAERQAAERPMASAVANVATAVTALPRLPFLHQLSLLSQRYAELIWRDRRGLALTFFQAPIIAAVFLLGFFNKPFDQTIPVPRKLKMMERSALEAGLEQIPDGDVRRIIGGLVSSDTPLVPVDVVPDPRYNYHLLFILCVTVLWLGCNNSAKEIVKESAVYGRERAVNLSILPYLSSKFLLQAALTVAQTTLLVGCVYGAFELSHALFGTAEPDPRYHLDYASLLAVFALLGVCGVCLGLALSALVSSTDQANAMLPYVLIPQFILGGGVLNLDGEPLRTLAFLFSPVYWAYRAARTGETEFPPDFPYHGGYGDPSLALPLAAIAGQAALLFVVAGVALWRRDHVVR